MVFQREYKGLKYRCFSPPLAAVTETIRTNLCDMARTLDAGEAIESMRIHLKDLDEFLTSLRHRPHVHKKHVRRLPDIPEDVDAEREAEREAELEQERQVSLKKQRRGMSADQVFALMQVRRDANPDVDPMALHF